MLDFLNPLTLPIKYAILLAPLCLLAAYLADRFAFTTGDPDYVTAVLAGTLAGLVGGYLRQLQGKQR